MRNKFKKDKLEVLVFEDRNSLGQTAAKIVSEKFKELLVSRPHINVIFAAAPSQNEFLAALIEDITIPWSKINAFHMDEYLGLPETAPQQFGTFLRARLFSLVPFLSVNYINGNAYDVQDECRRYAALLDKNPPDVVCMGIGENTHIAFNDPHKADFNDPEKVKMVELDRVCRQQQVNDGCFASLKEVPGYALTLTIPTLMQATFVYCMVPGKTKAAAVAHTLNQPISKDHPSTILRKHTAAMLFVDMDSYSML
jgi:glucosamine-6-phosphate deaminase